MNISSAICHTVRIEEKRTHVIAWLSDVISMETLCRKDCVISCRCRRFSTEWDVLNLSRVLVATVQVLTQSTFFDCRRIKFGAVKAPSSWLSLLCHQQIHSPCGTLHHCSFILGSDECGRWEGFQRSGHINHEPSRLISTSALVWGHKIFTENSSYRCRFTTGLSLQLR